MTDRDLTITDEEREAAKLHTGADDKTVDMAELLYDNDRDDSSQRADGTTRYPEGAGKIAAAMNYVRDHDIEDDPETYVRQARFVAAGLEEVTKLTAKLVFEKMMADNPLAALFSRMGVPPEVAASAFGSPSSHPSFGESKTPSGPNLGELGVTELTPELAEQLGIDVNATGLVHDKEGNPIGKVVSGAELFGSLFNEDEVCPIHGVVHGREEPESDVASGDA